MNNKIALLIIDGQNDFMDLPGSTLPVAGACKDMDRVIAFIKANKADIGNISCTLDSHRTIDISHPSFWMKADNTPIDVFTPVTSVDITSGKYTARFAPSWANKYIDKLEKQGEFTHFIWPYHCLIGSKGASMYEPLHKAINEWEAEMGVPVNFVTKGDNPYTEHFGALRANIEMPEDPKTQLNQQLIQQLMRWDMIYLAGEAKSHCVANTLRQIYKEVPQLAAKLTILTDCMSDVPNMGAAFYAEVDKIYDAAKQAGVKFAKSTDSIMATV